MYRVRRNIGGPVSGVGNVMYCYMDAEVAARMLLCVMAGLVLTKVARAALRGSIDVTRDADIAARLVSGSARVRASGRELRRSDVEEKAEGSVSYKPNTTMLSLCIPPLFVTTPRPSSCPIAQPFSPESPTSASASDLP